MIQHIKNFWKRYMATALTLSVPAAFAGGVEFGKQAPVPIDCKGVTCSIVVEITEPGFRGQRKYVKSEWEVLTPQDVKADYDKRIKDFKDTVKRQSELTTPENEVIE